MPIRRIFVEKKKGCDVQAKKTENDIRNILGLNVKVRYFLRYDIEGMTDAEFGLAAPTIFSEPPVDIMYSENLPEMPESIIIGTEFLPGGYDQRADSAAQCVQLLTTGRLPVIRCANIYAISGADSAGAARIAGLLINPIESRECSHEKPKTLTVPVAEPEGIRVVEGFRKLEGGALVKFYSGGGFAMTTEDLASVRDYFVLAGREPTETELRVIDTYWSDHCRHTTFLTELENIEVTSENPHIRNALADYGNLFDKHHGDKQNKYKCLMDIATIAVRDLKRRGLLPMLDESEEINACSIKVNAVIGGREEEWLVMFKNETHNHPTEIEPYGGAATCLGGAIRDPLSGRVYVYHAMRVSGAADINEPIEKTLKGKLPQRVISKTAAAGFSSYGNQIGLATGLVSEVFHSGYRAKRLEAGFVVGAAPKANVVRMLPLPGDIVLLIGGETGRDGCGGATGSSKAHDITSIETSGAEVQKGNPLTERKIQRLFRNPEFSRRIKRSNDFGAGGVSVAIGELADSIDIDLDAVPKKYLGLGATELAISESQERMAVVIARGDLDDCLRLCAEENLRATKVADITDTGRMIMRFGGEKAVDLERSFLNTNGIRQKASAIIEDKITDYFSRLGEEEEQLLSAGDYPALFKKILAAPGVCSQKGLAEMFDSTIGAGSVIMPFGGKNQLTPAKVMAAKLPAADAETATVAAYGFYPALMSESPFVGAVYSVLDSVIKLVAAGTKYNTIHLTFQEYFEKLRKDPARWGKPVSALLGALNAQLNLSLGAVGGKDSMSGSFEEIDVPPSLISFAIGLAPAGDIIDNVLDKSRTKLYRYRVKRDRYGMPDYYNLLKFLRRLETNITDKKIGFADTVGQGGAAAAVIKSCLGNSLGFDFSKSSRGMFTPVIGDIIFSLDDISVLADKSQNEEVIVSGNQIMLGGYTFDIDFIGMTDDSGVIKMGGTAVPLAELQGAFSNTFENIYPTTADQSGSISDKPYAGKRVAFAKHKTAKPKVFIPVFPGTNCEYDIARAFERAGAEAETFVVKNLSPADIDESVRVIASMISKSNIIAFPGGFSGGDEPDGSGKFIATTFRNKYIAEALEELMSKRDGLIIGICNGFQALIKLGLLPDGRIAKMTDTSPTLTFNTISRHVSQIAYIKVMSTMSPWLSGVSVGDVFGVPVSHGEGRFLAGPDELSALEKSGRVATKYAGPDGIPTMNFPYNPNGSLGAVEGITSADGRIFGKMGHAERAGIQLLKNVPAEYDMKIFESGVKYFK